MSAGARAAFGRRRLIWSVALTLVAALVGVAAVIAPPLAHASGCDDSWTGTAGDGNWATGGNWSEGHAPTPSENACITLAGTYTVTLGVAGGADSTTVASLTLGGSTGTQTLDLHGVPSTGNTTLTAGSVTVNTNGAITIDCGSSMVTCNSSGAEGLQMTSGDLSNAGVITTTAANSTDLYGDLVNTGTLAIDNATAVLGEGSRSSPVTLDNEGTIDLSDGAALFTVNGEADTVTNDTGGAIDATGSGTVIVQSSGIFDEGAGTTSGSLPVTLANGSSLDVTGAGASSFVMLDGGSFNLSGALHVGQSLTVDEVQGTGAVGGSSAVSVASGFTNAGSILLECLTEPGSTPCNDTGYESLQVASGTMTNSGQITTTAANDTYLYGNVVNTGTLDVENSGAVFGQGTAPSAVTLDNEGTIDLSDGAALFTVNGEADTVTNDTGGAIDATGSGTVIVQSSGIFDEGAGTTSGSLPVTLANGSSLDVTGAGASSFVMLDGGSFNLSGALHVGQSLTVDEVQGTGAVGGSSAVSVASGFTNAGSILLECLTEPGSTPCNIFGTESLTMASGALVNTGVLTATAANTMQVAGGLTNDGTVVLGSNGGTATLDVSGNYTQNASGQLSIDINGVSAGQFSVLSDTGSPTLGGTLALMPSSAYASSATTGDSAAILTYTGTRTGTFTVTTSPQDTVAPAISPTPRLGTQLTCSEGSWSDSPTTFAYQWNRDGAPIADATSSTYTVQSADVGHGLSCTVTAGGGAPLDGGRGFTAVDDDASMEVNAVVGTSFAQGSTAATSATVSVAATPITISPATLPQAVGANPYSQVLTACGGSSPSCQHYSTTAGTLVYSSGAVVHAGEQYSFSVASGSLPPGITLSTEGLLSGVPIEAGNFGFVVKATDPTGASGVSATLVTVVPGLSIQDGSYVLGGAIPAGAATILPDGSGPIASVRMSSAGNPYVPVTGTGSADDQVGVQLTSSDLSCTTDLQIAGSAGLTLTSTADLTTGCAQTASDSASDSAARARSHRGAIAHASASAERASSRSRPIAHAAAELTGDRRGPAASSAQPAIEMVSGGAQILNVGGVAATEPAPPIPTVSSEGGFNVTFPPQPTGGYTVEIKPGSYVSELQGTTQITPIIMSLLIDTTASLPPVTPVTPLTTFTETNTSGFPPPLTVNGTPVTNPVLLSEYGFPTGTQAETIPPSFVSSGTPVVTPISIIPPFQGLLGSIGPITNEGGLVGGLSQLIGDGGFDGTPNGQPVPEGSAALPVATGTNHFVLPVAFPAPGLPAFPPLVSDPIDILPIAPIQPISGTINRLGPAAFSEMLYANSPSLAKPPFSSATNAFNIEIVASR
jgi:hypothetical protein